jgi:hypothetical protein
MRLPWLFAVAILAAAAPARADFNLALGLKWIPASYTTPVSATGGMMGPTPTPLTGWQTTSLNNNFGVFILDGKLGFLLGLDLGYSSAHRDTTAGAVTANTDYSFTQFGFSLGSKYYILKPNGGHVSPYVAVDFYKYFASVSTSDKTVTNDQAGYIAGLASPLGFDAALGAEYFFTPGFSVGAEVLGLKYAYSEGDYAPATGKITARNQYLTLYTGLSLNYRFQIAATVHVRDTEEEEVAPVRPRPKRKAEPPPEAEPKEPPPAEAEPVD